VLPPSLVGETHEGGFLCSNWELRITARCLRDDLQAASGSSFEDVSQHEIVKALVRDRRARTEDTRQVSQIRTGLPVWVLSRGHDHRGATVFDDVERVVWLVAYSRHRSGAADDFFPYCRSLAAAGDLLPTEADYERLIRERDRRFAYAVTIEAAYVLAEARRTGEEQRIALGGRFGTLVSVEVDRELEAEAITLALKIETVVYDYLPVILAAFEPTDEWAQIYRLPTRELMDDEMAWTVTRVTG
jgi:hypothetical protein